MLSIEIIGKLGDKKERLRISLNQIHRGIESGPMQQETKRSNLFQPGLNLHEAQIEPEGNRRPKQIPVTGPFIFKIPNQTRLTKHVTRVIHSRHNGLQQDLRSGF